MTRSVACLAFALLAVGLANAQDARLAADLRQHNTALLRARHMDRALVARDEVVVQGERDLLTVCQQTQTTLLFLTVRSVTTGQLGPADTYRWRQLVGQAHRQGMRVYAVCGDSGTVADYGVLLDTVDRLMTFGASGLPGEQFDGLLVDLPVLSSLMPVEPATSTPGTTQPTTTVTWPLQPNIVGLPDLVKQMTLLVRLREHLQTRYTNTPFAIGCTVPVTLTTEVSFRGHTKSAAEHFVDLCDFVVGHNLPHNTTDIAVDSDALLAYAGSVRRPVYLRLEVRPTVYDSLKFTTLFGSDQLLVEQTVSDIIAAYGTRPGLGGIVVDDWVHWVAMPVVRPAERDPVPTTPVDLDPARQSSGRPAGR